MTERMPWWFRRWAPGYEEMDEPPPPPSAGDVASSFRAVGADLSWPARPDQTRRNAMGRAGMSLKSRVLARLRSLFGRRE